VGNGGVANDEIVHAIRSESTKNTCSVPLELVPGQRLPKKNRAGARFYESVNK